MREGCNMIHGDCSVLLPTIDVLFDGVLTSPPYNLGSNPRHRKKGENDREMYLSGAFVDAKNDEDYISQMVDLFHVLETKVAPKGVIIWNMGVSSKNGILPFLMISSVHERTAWTIGDVIYWKKSTAMPFQTSPNKSSPFVEPCYVFCKKSHIVDFCSNKKLGKQNEKTGQQFYKPVPNFFDAKNGTSTQLNKATFSQDMATELLRRYFKAGQHVLDPFCGSGTTITAGKKIGIQVTGIEIDKDQVDAFYEQNE